MRKRNKIVFATAVSAAVLCVAGAATLPETYFSKVPPTTRDKINKFLKEKSGEKAREKLVDKFRDKAVDLIMYEGAKHIGGPFTKGGGDEEIAREIVTDLIDPREWNPLGAAKAVPKTVISGSKTQSPRQDVPGAYVDSKGQWQLPDNGMAESVPTPAPKDQSCHAANPDNFLDDDDFETPPSPGQVLNQPSTPTAPTSLNPNGAHTNPLARAEGAGQMATGQNRTEN